MRRALFALMLVAAGPAFADAPEPSRQAIAKAAQTCTAEGAFGLRFGGTSSDAGQDIPPFAVDQVSSRAGIFRITAHAWFGKAPMSAEDRRALAGWVVRALDSEAGKRGFARREQRADGVTYTSASAPHAGYALDISHEGVDVWIVCTDFSDTHSKAGRPDD
jgi:hypothetical protein